MEAAREDVEEMGNKTRNRQNYRPWPCPSYLVGHRDMPMHSSTRRSKNKEVAMAEAKVGGQHILQSTVFGFPNLLHRPYPEFAGHSTHSPNMSDPNILHATFLHPLADFRLLALC